MLERAEPVEQAESRDRSERRERASSGMQADAREQPDSRRLVRPLSRGQQLAVTAIVAYALVQIAVPLRRFAYPGDSCWTEQGFRFSWNVMLVEKNGDVQITAHDPASGKRWDIDPRDTLLAYQIKQMSTQPDMILEFCRHIAADFRHKGYRDIVVRAGAHVAYNGRPSAPLIDSTVDLGREHDGFAPYRFLRPSPGSQPEF